ncbi:FAD-dependent monooxygenase [Amycolatopsis sp. PS_44_ISF1]|uniref:FAD-dependent oxidoreductase n=1 Tax=Amycolatopsis sp. PS_44_ISF1 TaxID=2974917 RepID=UPI0028DF1A39|nr:FAD-dependent monooxygenase [Amycolatopsis sp. PS_44_ISF1]MDT8911430.1 FAD-dependent monooxygenase [Amycolatopsis sp. PS_44_ISF1]
MPSSAARRFVALSTGEPPGPGRVFLRRAVVLGGSVAGLMAARVLSDHAEEVLVVERDAIETDGAPRPGVPQGGHVHALLPAGVVQLERWYPGFTAEAVADGAVTPPADGSLAELLRDGMVRQHPPGVQAQPFLLGTRPFLEAHVRRRTLAIGNVRQVTGRADGLVFDGGRVTGATYRSGEDDEPVTVTADLVLDATGRSSRLGDWLAGHGWERPPMRRMPIRLNYATAMFRRDERITDLYTVTSQAGAGSTPDGAARIGGFLRVEGDRWIMLISGYGEDRPTRDPQDFITRCRRDFPPVFGAIAERAELLGEVLTYHQADSRRRDFHAVRRFPAGLLAAGDAVASFNPVYGQGLTSAALHASCLSAYLRSGPSVAEPARSYFERVRVVVDAAWQISTFADFELPHVAGPRPPGYRLTRWLTGKLFAAAQTDVRIDERLDRAITMLAHPDSLADPALVARALWIGWTRRPGGSGRRGPAPGLSSPG